MAIEFEPHEQWDRVASELRAYKQTQQQAWGDIDNTTLGRYLADDLSGDEREHVEAALSQLPELRKLTELVRDVLDEFDPAAPIPVPEVPTLLAFPQQSSAKKSFGRLLRQRGTLVAAACLLLGLGLTLGGMRLFSPTAFQKVAPPLDQTRAELPNGRARDVSFAKNAEKSPQVKEQEMLTGWKQLGTSATTVLAATQEEVGDYYGNHGDVDRAETFLTNARELRRKTLGDNDPGTVRTNEKLAQVYQVALNTVPPADPSTVRVTSNYPLVSSANPAATPPLLMAKRGHAYEKACVLRERLTRQNPAEVKQAVVPVLVDGFRSAKTTGARQSLARALGTLGPAAADAVADLKNTLEAKDTPNEERVVVLWALGQIGPAARPAVPALMDALQFTCPEVQRAAADALVKLTPYARQEVFANAKKEPLSHELLARLQGPEGRIGVNDSCLSYSSHALHETQRQIQLLARRHHVELYTETVATTPAKDAKKADERAKEVSANGIYLLICKEPPGVQVVVAEALRRQGFTPQVQAELQQRAEEGVKKRDFDRGLVQSVRYVTQFFERAENRSKIRLGAVGGGAVTTLLPR